MPRSLPGGTEISVDRRDLHCLIDALWDVSAMQGAVVAIGNIQHRLAESHTELEFSELEARVIRAALQRAENLPRGLTSV